MADLTAVLRPLVAHTLRQAAAPPPPTNPQTLSRRRFAITYAYSFLSLIIIAGFALTSYNFEDIYRLLLNNATTVCIIDTNLTDYN